MSHIQILYPRMPLDVYVRFLLTLRIVEKTICWEKTDWIEAKPEFWRQHMHLKPLSLFISSSSLLLMPLLGQALWTGADSTWTQPDADSFDVTYNSGDNVQFGNSGVGTVITGAGGVSPGSLLINNSSGSYIFSGLSANPLFTGTGSLIHSASQVTEFQSTRSLLSDPNPFSFSGGSFLSGGTVILKFSLEGESLGLGTGAVTLSNGARFIAEQANFRDDSLLRTVTNNFIIGAGGGEIFTQRSSGNPSFTFSGGLDLSGNLRTGNFGGSGRAFFVNNVNLSDNASLSGDDASYFGSFIGATRNLSILSGANLIFGDGDNSAGPSLSLDVANLAIGGRLTIRADSSSNDVFSTIRDVNGGTVSVQNGGRLTLVEGKYDLNDISLDSGGILELNPGNSIANLDLSDSPSFTVGNGRSLYHGASGPPDHVELDIIVENGGTLVTGELKKRRGYLRGTLTLLDGSTFSLSTNSNNSEGGGYIIDDDNPADGIVLGSVGTDSTVRIVGGNSGQTQQVATTVIQANNITQNGNVTLRYESLRDDRWFKLGYDAVGIGSDFDNDIDIANPFLAGNSRTQFAPLLADPGETHGAGIMVLGPEAQTVFVSSSTTELVTQGQLIFWSVDSDGQARFDVTNEANNRGERGSVQLLSGGSFDFVEDGSILLNTLLVENGASISGTGSIDGDLQFNGGIFEVVLNSASSANVLSVSANVSGNGIIQVNNGGFTPTPGTTLEVISNGSFGSENLSADNGWQYIGDGQIQFAIPEPSSLLLCLGGLFSLNRLRRRRGN